jgi:hypothetical protein
MLRLSELLDFQSLVSEIGELRELGEDVERYRNSGDMSEEN